MSVVELKNIRQPQRKDPDIERLLRNRSYLRHPHIREVLRELAYQVRDLVERKQRAEMVAKFEKLFLNKDP